MTLVNTETGEIVEVTYAEVKASISIARESGTKFFEQIVWQIEHQVWTTLGYSSWDEMRETEYADMGVVVPRADRPEVVNRLRRSGLTQQQIATTLGVGQKTVSRDLNSHLTNDAPAAPITNSRGQQRPASYTPRTPVAEPVEEADDAAGVAQDEVAGSIFEPEPAHRPADPPADSQLESWLANQQGVQDAQYLSNLLKVVKTSMAITSFDAERVSRIADEHDLMALEALASSIADWHRKVTLQRSGLRVLKGGAR